MTLERERGRERSGFRRGPSSLPSETRSRGRIMLIKRNARSRGKLIAPLGRLDGSLIVAPPSPPFPHSSFFFLLAPRSILSPPLSLRSTQDAVLFRFRERRGIALFAFLNCRPTLAKQKLETLTRERKGQLLLLFGNILSSPPAIVSYYT